MKKIIPITLILIILLCGCAKTPTIDDGFEFSLTFGIEGTSSYNSKTGELIRTKHSQNPEKYTATMTLPQDKLNEIANIINELNINSYPDKYDPVNDPKSLEIMTSSPSRTIILTVTTPEFTKTVNCSDIDLFGGGYNAKSKAFLSAIDKITEIITETDEWKAFPELDFGFC